MKLTVIAKIGETRTRFLQPTRSECVPYFCWPDHHLGESSPKISVMNKVLGTVFQSHKPQFQGQSLITCYLKEKTVQNTITCVDLLLI